MNVLHMDTDSVNKVAVKMQDSVTKFYQSFESTLKDNHRIDWQGESRDEFLDSLCLIQRNFNLSLESLGLLTSQLQKEILQWEEAAAHFQNGTIANKSPIDSSSSGDNVYDNQINKLIDLYGFIFGVKTLEGSFSYLLTNQKAKANDFRNEIEKANLRFQLIDEDGSIVSEFGAEDGDIVSVQWIHDEDSTSDGGYNPGPPTTIRINDRLKHESEYKIRETLTHEMQHALDFQTGQVDSNIIQSPYDTIDNSTWQMMNDDELSSYDWSALEKDLESSSYEVVKTEIHAWDRGYSFDPKQNPSENLLNMDQNYTPEECKFVLNDRDYASLYFEKNIQDSFAEKGLNVDADVYWDNNSNQIHVDILNVEHLPIMDGYYA